MALLKFENVSFTYALNNEKTLSNINLEIEAGEIVAVCGKTGSGKSTLLKLLKKEIRPVGNLTGTIYYDGKNLDDLTLKESVINFGYVMQNVDAQIVMDKVYSELAFGLSNLGYENDIITLKIAEICNYFGINEWFYKNTNELSGGQKQILNLASILVMQPKVLLIDEATSQLDPINASNFLDIIKKINEDFKITIIIIDHKLDELFNLASKVLVLDEGKVVAFTEPRKVALNVSNPKLFNIFPTMFRIAKTLRWEDYPLTIKEGKKLLSKYKDEIKYLNIFEKDQGKPLITLHNIYFKYSPKQKDILEDLNLTVYENEVLSIIGGNGSGKTTLLKIVARLLHPYHGKINLNGKNLYKLTNKELYYKNISLLPQNPKDLFFKMSVREELDYENYKNQEILNLINNLDITNLLDKHPDDLSGGEIQKVAFAKILLQEPKIILLDEPTKGLDNYLKESLIEIIQKLKENKITIVIVSHDVDFCARISDRVGLIFAGKIMAINQPRKFFQDNYFYTTITNKIAKEKYPNVITENDLYEILKLNGGL